MRWIGCALMLLAAAPWGGAEPANLTGRQWADGNVKHPQKAALKKPFNDACAALKDKQPDKAISLLQQALQKDKQNGLLYYLMSSAYTQKKDWKQAVAQIKAGNRCKECYEYLTETGMSQRHRLRLHLPYIRAAAKMLAEQAKGFPTSEHADALKAACQMGRHVSHAYPREMIAVLVGAAICNVASKGLVRLYEGDQDSQALKEARHSAVTYRKWAEQVKSLASEMMNKSAAYSRVKGLDDKRFEQPLEKLSPQDRQKIEKSLAEFAPVEEEYINKALRLMPK